MSGERKRVVHISTVHSADDTRILFKEASSLAEAGYIVDLIAPYKESVKINNVRITAIPRSNTRLERITKSATRALKIALQKDADIYHFHDPELIPYAYYLKRVRRKKVIFDIHEDVPAQIMSKEWIPNLLKAPVRSMTFYTISHAIKTFDGVIFAEPIALKKMNIAAQDKVIVVQNYPNIKEMEFIQSISTEYANRPYKVAYLGGISTIRGANEMVDAIAEVDAKWNAKLVLGGKFTPASLRDQLRRRRGWANVDYKGWLSREEVIEVLAQARAGLVTLHPEPNYIEAYPVKMFEYMAAGIPVIASDFPLWRQILHEIGAGILVDPLDPSSIASAIEWIFRNPEEAKAMGVRGQTAVRELYNWDNEKRKLLALYKEVLSK